MVSQVNTEYLEIRVSGHAFEHFAMNLLSQYLIYLYNVFCQC